MSGGLAQYDGKRLGLYFDLREGETADLEVIARASIAWVEALRAAVQVVEPDADIRVKVVDADEGSLLINAIISWLDERIDDVADWHEGLPRSRKLMIVFAIFMIFTAGPTYDSYFGDDEVATQAQVDAAVKRLSADASFMEKKRLFYQSLEQDPAIKGVGIKRDVDDDPDIYVDSKHFAQAGGLWQDMDEDTQERTTSTVVDVVLVKPALKGTALSWTFEAPGVGTFSAIMKDPTVLRAMREAGLPERVREGIPMRVRLQVREIAVDGSWKVAKKGRVITHVLSPQLD